MSMEISEDRDERATVASAPAVTAIDLQKICHYMSEWSPLPTVAAEGLPHIVLYANPAFCQLVGKQKAALIGHPFAEAVPERDENGCIALLDRVYRTGKTETLAEQGHFTTLSSPVYWSYSVWAVLDPEEHSAGVIIQVTDSTKTTLFRQQVTSMNQALLLSSVRQHELTEKAEALREQAEELSRRLQHAMQETHHRIKNNLQVVSALAEIQLSSDGVTVPMSAMQRIATHTQALADLHDLLTQQARGSASGDTLDTKTSLDRLMVLLQTSVGMRRIHSYISEVPLSIDRGSSLSLLVSELVSNAYKHGAGDINVTLTQEGEEARLSVSDRGSGFPADFDPHVAAHTGLEIILTLAEHDLRGRIQFTNRPDGGACILVAFPC
jgi:two-component sensor histidine kinase